MSGAESIASIDHREAVRLLLEAPEGARVMSAELRKAFADADAVRPSAESVRAVLDRSPSPERGEVLVAISNLVNTSPSDARSAIHRLNAFLDTIPAPLRTVAPVPELAAATAFGIPLTEERQAELYRQLADLLAIDARVRAAVT